LRFRCGQGHHTADPSPAKDGRTRDAERFVALEPDYIPQLDGEVGSEYPNKAGNGYRDQNRSGSSDYEVFIAETACEHDPRGADRDADHCAAQCKKEKAFDCAGGAEDTRDACCNRETEQYQTARVVEQTFAL
jgi:hypothetical protein